MPRRLSRSDLLRNMRRFYSYLGPYPWELGGIFLLLLVFSVLQLVSPYLFGRIIDQVGQHAPWKSVAMLLTYFGATLALRSMVLLVRNYLLQEVGMKVTCDLRVQIFAHLQRLSLRFYESRQTGKIVSRITDDTNSVHALVTAASVNMVSDVIVIVGVMIFLLSQNLQLTLLTYAVLPLFVMNYLWHRRRMRSESRRHRRQWDKVISFLHEKIASARLIRSFAAESVELEMFKQGIEGDQENYNRVVWRNTLLGTGAELINSFGTLLILAYGSWMVYRHQDHFTIGDLVAFSMYLGLLYVPIVRLVDANAAIQRAATSLEKIFTLLDTRPQVPDNDQLPSLPEIAGGIKFDSVSFAYRPREEVLRNVSFQVDPGQMVAFVGPSGAGKTTIISLLARFYEPSQGRILIDGHDLQSFNTQSVRRQIGLVMQDNVLFSGTIEENIKYGRSTASHAEMIAAAEAANAHEFIEKLANGYQSRVGERGVQLSGGQRQRIAIARVILKDPRILIFDEATSALDTYSERLIQQATVRVMRGRTSLVIAHRLSTVVHADLIVVMEGGQIVELGRHQELLARGQLYQRLYDLQFAD